MKKIMRILKQYAVTYRGYKNLLNSVVDPAPNLDSEGDEVFVFNTVRNITPIMHIEFFLAFCLAKKGKKSIVILDDGVLSHWDSVHDINVNGALTPLKSNVFRRWYTEFNRKVVCYLYSHQLIEYVFLGELIKGLNASNVDISGYYEIIESAAKSSCRRYSSSTSFRENYEDKAYYRLSYDNGVTFALAAYALQQRYRIKKLITSHGIYSCWGVLFEIFKKNGVPCLMYSELIYSRQHALLSDVLILLIGLI
jgi:hypothetical protein